MARERAMKRDGYPWGERKKVFKKSYYCANKYNALMQSSCKVWPQSAQLTLFSTQVSYHCELVQNP